HFGDRLKGSTIALWGLAFKPNTDDMREAPSRTIMEMLWEGGVKVRAYDPVAGAEAQRIYGDRTDLALCKSAYEAVEGADALAIDHDGGTPRAPSSSPHTPPRPSWVSFADHILYDGAVGGRCGLSSPGGGGGKGGARAAAGKNIVFPVFFWGGGGSPP